jgi:plastocyanin
VALATVPLGVISVGLLVRDAGSLADALLHPESPADFAVLSMLTVGVAVATLCTLPAVRSTPGRSGGARRKKAAGRAALILVAGAAAWSLTGSAWGARSAAVTMEAFDYRPQSVTAAAGRVTLSVTNNDTSGHTFTSDALAVDVSVAPGQTRRIRFEAERGRYDFYCKPHTPGMEGELIVK